LEKGPFLRSLFFKLEKKAGRNYHRLFEGYLLMIFLLKTKVSEKEAALLENRLRSLKITYRKEKLRNRLVIIVESYSGDFPKEEINGFSAVEKVISPENGYFLASSEFKPKWKKFSLNGTEWKQEELLLAAGPCAIESEKDLDEAAGAVKAGGGRILRGGSFKPRTSPYSFQGLGKKGVEIHRKVADRYGLLMLTEVLDREDLRTVYDSTDIVQIGSRNMQNFPLLKELGKLEKPVLLKRGFGALREEFLLAAEYILQGGNEKVILCERGLRGFNPAGKHVLDVASIALLKELTWLPLIVDPSHAAGDSRYVPVLAKAAVIAGADGLLMEVHPAPKRALSDGPQALTIKEFKKLAGELGQVAGLCGKTLGVS
jgi:3-deoxy-7-phosphoheptulonate synthase